MKNKKCLVVGCGRFGANVAHYKSSNGFDCLIVDLDARAFRKLDVNFSGYEVVGDATDLDFLENQCDIKNIDEIVITTNNDSVNLYVSHVAYNIYNTKNIFVRFNDVDKGLLIKDTNIKVIYPFHLSMEEFLMMEKQNENSNS